MQFDLNTSFIGPANGPLYIMDSITTLFVDGNQILAERAAFRDEVSLGCYESEERASEVFNGLIDALRGAKKIIQLPED